MKRYTNLLIIFSLLLIFGICYADDTDISSLQQLNGKRIGTLTGSVGGPAIEENIPDAKILYFDSVSDLLPAMQTNKIDAMCYDDSVFKYLKLDVKDLKILIKKLIILLLIMKI